MRRHGSTADPPVDDADVERILDSLRDRVEPERPADVAHRSDLDAALRAFRASHPTGTLSAPRMISPLLDLWALASAVGPQVAAPIERLLKALPDRAVVTGAELDVCVDDVEAALDDLPA